MNNKNTTVNNASQPDATIPIPDHWTPEQADFLLNLLDDLNCAIWDTYGWALRRLWKEEEQELQEWRAARIQQEPGTPVIDDDFPY